MTRKMAVIVLLVFAVTTPVAAITAKHKKAASLSPAVQAKRRVTVIAYLKQHFGRTMDRAAYIKTVVSDERFKTDPTIFTGKRLSKRDDYTYLFNKNLLVEKGKKFLESDDEVLSAVGEQLEVDKGYITSVLAAETAIGEKPGTKLVVQSLLTIAVFRPDFKETENWAVNELGAFLVTCKRLGIDPYTIVGSWTGAHGWGQFEPTSFWLAMRWNGEKCELPKKAPFPDLFNRNDAICSVANYLHHYGFRNDDERAMANALHVYNGGAYADAVLDYSELLTGKECRHRWWHEPKPQPSEQPKRAATK